MNIMQIHFSHKKDGATSVTAFPLRVKPIIDKGQAMHQAVIKFSDILSACFKLEHVEFILIRLAFATSGAVASTFQRN
jgi:hypothetical protein